jgi:hypothetical protein
VPLKQKIFCSSGETYFLNFITPCSVWTVIKPENWIFPSNK